MSKFEDGMKRGFKVLKQLGREDTMLNHKEIYPDLYKLSVGHLFGDIWTRPHLGLRDRELITLAALVALAYHPEGIHSHCRSAQHIGITKEEIMELIIQVGAYAGWPTMGLAIREFAKVLEEGAVRKKKNKQKNNQQKRGRKL
jgi:4-carboxymuconolactone decarboxylase